MNDAYPVKAHKGETGRYCRVNIGDEIPEDRRTAALLACGYEEVPWEALPTFDSAKAIEIVDRVCAGAHKFLGAAGSA